MISRDPDMSVIDHVHTVTMSAISATDRVPFGHGCEVLPTVLDTSASISVPNEICLC
jgi:hypothetical protein